MIFEGSVGEGIIVIRFSNTVGTYSYHQYRNHSPRCCYYVGGGGRTERTSGNRFSAYTVNRHVFPHPICQNTSRSTVPTYLHHPQPPIYALYPVVWSVLHRAVIRLHPATSFLRLTDMFPTSIYLLSMLYLPCYALPSRFYIPSLTDVERDQTRQSQVSLDQTLFT